MTEEQDKKQELQEKPTKPEQLKEELTEEELKSVDGGGAFVNDEMMRMGLLPWWQWTVLAFTSLLRINPNVKRATVSLPRIVKADTSLQEKLIAVKSDADAVVLIANEAGFMISADDLKKAQSEISDEELDEASGGTISLCYIFVIPFVVT